MVMDLVLSPSGRLLIAEAPGERAVSKLARAFAISNSEGLFTLAAQRLDPSAPASYRYWRQLGSQLLDQACQSPAGVEAAPEFIAPSTAELSSLLLSVPPMAGAEYVSIELLGNCWSELCDWFSEQVAAHKNGMEGFLHERAPLWKQVGLICFHLVENRRDLNYPFAFLATYATSVNSSGKVQYQRLSQALDRYAGAKNKSQLIRLLLPVQSATESSELMQELVESGDIYQPLAWTADDAYRFLKDAPHMEASGIAVRLPDWWKKRPRPKVGVTIGNARQQRLDSDQLLDFRMDIALGDAKLTDDEWQSLLEGEAGLVLLRGQWVEVDRSRLEEAIEHWRQIEQQAANGLSFNEGMRLLAGAPADLGHSMDDVESDEWSFVDAGKWLGELLDDLRNPATIAAAKPGKALKATLRPYQEIGVSWLTLLSRMGLGACLADDMGLGKTIQVISFLLVDKKRQAKSANRKPSLLVLPASLLANWKSEIERFAPSLRIRFVHPSIADKDEMNWLAQNPTDKLNDVDAILTSYGMLLRQEWLLDVHWNVIVLDEAQAIKNPGTRQTKIVKQLRADSRIALTGTPVENRLSDLWSLFDFLCPGLLGGRTKFKNFVKSLESRTADQYAPLRRLVCPYILRRLKTDKSVIADLPDKTEVTAFCSLSKRQAVLYKKLVNEMARGLDDQSGIQRRGLVLSYLMRFKQLCNHPSQLLGTGEFAAKDSGKFLRLEEICDEVAQRGEKVLVFTQFREMATPLSGTFSECVRSQRPDSSWRNSGQTPQAVGGRVPTGGWAAIFRAVTKSRRDRLEPDSSFARNSLRSLVESGRRKPSDRSGLPHWAETQCISAQVRLPRDHRRTHRHVDR